MKLFGYRMIMISCENDKNKKTIAPVKEYILKETIIGGVGVKERQANLRMIRLDANTS